MAPPTGDPDPLHWAQLQGLRRDVCPTICRGRVDSAPDLLRAWLGTHHRISGAVPGRGFSQFFASATDLYAHWVADHRRWCETRNASLVPLPFPYAQYRPGQREFAVAVYRAIQRGERLFAEAPTGIGKTVSALYPALKALGEEKLERIFYLTARTTARAVAEKALADLLPRARVCDPSPSPQRERSVFRTARPVSSKPVPWRAGISTVTRPP